MIFSIFNRKFQIKYEKPIQGDIKFSGTKIKKSKEYFQYSSKTKLEEGRISKTFF